MKVKTFYSILLFLLIMSQNSVFSAITAHFIMDNNQGCPPLIVTFTNQSDSGSSITYDWDLGLGSHVFVKNPVASYTTPKKYPVTLIVTNNLTHETASFVDTVTVFQGPTANFSSIQTGCVPYNAQFTDLSTQGSAPVTSWLWDFREGTTKTVKNPTYNYTIAGQHDVFLEVTDANGCKSNINRLHYIDVVTPPVAIFSPSTTFACKIPTTLTFTNHSTGTGLTYNWNFGDGNNSNALSPSHIYTAFGSYNVKLVTKSSYGCNDSTTTAINIADVIAQGTLKQGSKTIGSGTIICPGLVNYSSTSIGASSIKWVFGDGGSSTTSSGSHNYLTTGNFKALLIASPGTSCADTISWTFTIENIVANFTMAPTSSCQSPLLVSFTDQSTNPVSWAWTFDDGATSTTKNPTHIYQVPTETDPYAINIEHTFNSILQITSSHGCIASTSKTLRIKKPTAIHSVDTVMGCKPLKVKFSDKSFSDLAITSRKWLFGDGNTQTTSSDTTSHVFVTEGVYNTKLLITNSGGCTDTSYVIVVTVGKTLSPDFSVNPANACPNEKIQFIDNTAQSSLIQAWHYFVDGNSVESSPSDPNPYWMVRSDTGYSDVKLVVNYNGCISKTTKSKALFNKGPVANFNYTFSCSTPLNYSFSNSSIAADSYEWNFGDGSPVNIAVNPNHIYLTEGDFTVMLVATKNSCHDTIRKELKIRIPKAVITANSNSCRAVPVFIKGTSSYTLVDYCYERYSWDFGGVAPNLKTNSDSVSVSFPNRGNFTVKLKTEFDNGCLDSTTKLIRIFQPYVGIEADTTRGCPPFDVNFTDTSKADVNPLNRWTWNFDDGSSNLVYTTQTNPINHLFAVPGEFNVNLTVRDAIGCEGTDTIKVATANPNAQFSSDDPKGCVGEKINFHYSYPSPDSAIWKFGDGTVVRDTTNPIIHSYLNRGTYPVRLILYKYACPDTFLSPANYVQIQKADASFNVSDSIWNCYPKQITFTYNSTDSVVASLSKWEFDYHGNIGPFNNTVIFNYPTPGEYKPKLYIETNFGCRDTASRNISITGPTGTFSISPKVACSGDLITLNLVDTNHVFAFEWDMGDGSPFQLGNPVHYTYPDSTSGTINVTLLLLGDTIINSNIRCPASPHDTLTISVINAKFDYDSSALCDHYNIDFFNHSDGTGGFTSNWDFDNGNTSTDLNPVEQFDPGTYNIQLTAENAYNCKDAMPKKITIHPLPAIQVTRDTFICVDKSIVLHAVGGGDQITWEPDYRLSDPHSYNPTASPLITTDYKATVVDLINNCRNSDSLKLYVQQRPVLHVTLIPAIDSLIIGESVLFSVDSSDEFKYVWSPDYMLSCTHCASPTAQPLQNTNYLIQMSDTNSCFIVDSTISLAVKEQYSIVLPSAFTPGSSNANSVIYVKGSGIKELIEFRVFNRWGNEIFYTSDINQGWDGYYKGKLQNIDTYAYIVKAVMWDGREKMIKGTFNLLR